MKCAICNGKTGLFPTKIYRGHICKKCLSYLPYNIQLSTAEAGFLQELIIENKKKANQFVATACLGDLFLDSIHNMFLISKRNKHKEPLDFGQIFYIRELTGAGLFCSNVKNIGNSRDFIVCDVKFAFRTQDVSLDFTIAKRKRCMFVRKGNQIEWIEPGEVGVFRSIFLQMIDSVILSEKLEYMQKMQEESKGDVNWAKGVLLFPKDKDIPPGEIKARWRALIKLFHPDTLHKAPKRNDFAEDELLNISGIINDAYHQLK